MIDAAMQPWITGHRERWSDFRPRPLRASTNLGELFPTASTHTATIQEQTLPHPVLALATATPKISRRLLHREIQWKRPVLQVVLVHHMQISARGPYRCHLGEQAGQSPVQLRAPCLDLSDHRRRMLAPALLSFRVAQSIVT